MAPSRPKASGMASFRPARDRPRLAEGRRRGARDRRRARNRAGACKGGTTGGHRIAHRRVQVRPDDRPSGGLAVIAMRGAGQDGRSPGCVVTPSSAARHGRRAESRPHPVGRPRHGTGWPSPAPRGRHAPHLLSAVTWGIISQPCTSARPATPPPLSPDGRFLTRGSAKGMGARIGVGGDWGISLLEERSRPIADIPYEF